MLFILMLSVLTTEAITELLTKSVFFYPCRKYFFNKGKNNSIFKFIHSLLDCGYCTSVWVSSFISIFLVHYFIVTNCYLINYVLLVFVTHRLSNLINTLFDLIRIAKENSDL